MSMLYSEALMRYYVSGMYDLGFSKEELPRLLGMNNIAETGTPFIKIYSPQTVNRIFRTLHEFGWQEKFELARGLKLMDMSGFHTAYLLHSSNIKEVINKLNNIVNHHAPGSSFDIQIKNKRVYLYLFFNDDRSDFFTPYTYFSIFSKVIQEYFRGGVVDLELEIGVVGSKIINEYFISQVIAKNIRFNNDMPYISFPKYYWDINNEKYSETLQYYFDEQYQLHYGVEKKGHDKFISRVLSHVSCIYSSDESDGSAHIDTVAGKMNMSRSTLYRHLAERNLTFKEIVDNHRKDNALKYIRETTLGMGEICDKLGYSNLSAFNRAFKRWYDITPSLLRQRYK